jgi:thioredoxin 1
MKGMKLLFFMVFMPFMVEHFLFLRRIRMALTEVTGDTFVQEVLEADKPVLVDFWGPRCQPCLALMPVVERLAETYADSVKIVKINASIRPNWRLCGDHKVLGLPAYLFFKDGQEVKRITGDGITDRALTDVIEELIKAS